ncbi:MYLK2 kinase, partial [Oceanites oceanicus]|nr:MYLK2 kinase [Oceanites oceanicus]
MEQGSGAGSVPGAGGAGGMAPPEADGSTTQSVPATPQTAQPQAGTAASMEGTVASMEGTVTAATGAQDEGKDEPGQEKAPAAAAAQDGGQAEPGKEKAAGEAGGGKAEPVGEMARTAPEPGDGRKAAPAAEASAAQHDGGQAASAEEKVPAAVEAQDGGKDEPGKEKAPATGEPEGEKAAPMEGKAPAAARAQGGGKDEPREEKAPAAGEPEGGKAAPAEGKGLAVAEAQDGGKDEPTKEQAPGGFQAEGGGKAEPTEEKALAAVEAEGGKAKPAEETALAAAQARDGGKEEPAKEKTTAAAKSQDGGKKAAKAEKTPADKKPAKEKTPAAAKEKDGGKKAAKVEKNTVASKAEDGGKEEPAKQKAPAAIKAQDGGKQAAKVETPPVAAEAGDGGDEPTEAAATAAAEAQGEGEKVAKVEEMDEQQQPRGPEPPRPALLQSLSCPATCQRQEQPWAEAAAMEIIVEESTAAEPREGLTDLRGPGPAGSPGTPQERTLPSATGQPLDDTGAAEQPGPGQQPSSMDAEPPPSPYLTPDFGKEDSFEILDDVPPPPAPFAHRIVTLRSASVSSQFNLSSKEILGGGKFGEVHTCTEKQTGLKLAAKVIRKQGTKDKEMVLLEIDVMNQLNHRNLIQLYDAIETPREIILFMEFVEGGELFERIIDDDYQLTEVDCMVFVRQICEGISFMHHMRVLHLDLKPENILCVATTGHMVKIIDFGLARRYNPQEKLKVNFGTPEFLSPEVVNYEQVSYSTDMWSMGVITYMLLSGLSPFLGDNDTETLNNVLAANWYFDEETFESVSDEAKDFVSNLIIKEKSARMSAGQCLQHPWLNNLAEKAKRCNRRLKSQVLLKKYVMRRRWKKNFIGVCAANRFKKITSSGSLTALGV